MNFPGDKDYEQDNGVWKSGARYPTDNVQLPDLDFVRSPSPERIDGLLFNLFFMYHRVSVS